MSVTANLWRPATYMGPLAPRRVSRRIVRRSPPTRRRLAVALSFWTFRLMLEREALFDRPDADGRSTLDALIEDIGRLQERVAPDDHGTVGGTY